MPGGNSTAMITKNKRKKRKGEISILIDENTISDYVMTIHAPHALPHNYPVLPQVQYSPSASVIPPIQKSRTSFLYVSTEVRIATRSLSRHPIMNQSSSKDETNGELLRSPDFAPSPPFRQPSALVMT